MRWTPAPSGTLPGSSCESLRSRSPALVRAMARFDHIARSRRKRPLGALKVDREGRASPGLRLDRDRPAHPPHELARDVEAEARPAARSGELGVEAVELL